MRVTADRTTGRSAVLPRTQRAALLDVVQDVTDRHAPTSIIDLSPSHRAYRSVRRPDRRLTVVPADHQRCDEPGVVARPAILSAEVPNVEPHDLALAVLPPCDPAALAEVAAGVLRPGGTLLYVVRHKPALFATTMCDSALRPHYGLVEMALADRFDGLSLVWRWMDVSCIVAARA